MSSLLLGGVMIGAVAAPHADAAQGCGSRSLRKSFSNWGDYNDYFVAPAGDFEGALSAWNISGASPVAENEPWRVTGSGSRSMSIQPGGRIASKPFCMAHNEDSIRLMYKLPNGGGGIKVSVTATSSAGNSSSVWLRTSSTPGWKVTDRIMIPNVADGNGQMRVVISIESTNGSTILVDNVQVDPWRSN